MAMDAKDDLLPTLVPYLRRDARGAPYLTGVKCKACGNIFAGDRTVCAKCASRDQMQAVKLAETGKVYVYTIVHRSFPGVKTPFIDVIVDLDDGAHLKGTLVGVKADPDSIPFDLPVKLSYREIEPVNKPGRPHLAYVFEPMTPLKG